MCCELGAPGGTRTPDQELRRLLLYPTELQAPDACDHCGRRSALLHGTAEAVDDLGTGPGGQDVPGHGELGPAQPAADHREG